MEPLLQTDRLSVDYGGKRAVVDVSIMVGAGEIVTLLGHNGAGKSSLLNAIHGQIACRGSVNYDQQCVNAWPSSRRIQNGLVLVPQGHQVFRGLTVRQNLLLANSNDRSAANLLVDNVFKLFPRLGERINQAAGTLSGGEQQMLAVGMGLVARPRLLLIDEPTIGLAPAYVTELFNTLMQIRLMDNCAILLVEQNIDASLAISDRAYGIRRGEIVACSKASTFKQEVDLMEIM